MIVSGTTAELSGVVRGPLGLPIEVTFSVDGRDEYVEVSDEIVRHFGGRPNLWDTTQYSEGPHHVEMRAALADWLPCSIGVDIVVDNENEPVDSGSLEPFDAGAMSEAGVQIDSGAIAIDAAAMPPVIFDAGIGDAATGAAGMSAAGTSAIDATSPDAHVRDAGRIDAGAMQPARDAAASDSGKASALRDSAVPPRRAERVEQPDVGGCSCRVGGSRHGQGSTPVLALLGMLALGLRRRSSERMRRQHSKHFRVTGDL